MLIILSDGIPELFNENKEQFDYGRVQNIIAQADGKLPNEVIDELIAGGEEWRASEPQADDITIVVIRAL